MKERTLDVVVATGETVEKAEKKFQKKLTKKIGKGWTPKVEESVKEIKYGGELVYMVYQIIQRKE